MKYEYICTIETLQVTLNIPFVGVAGNQSSQLYIIQRGTEDKFCLLPYTFGLWYFTWYNLHESAAPTTVLPHAEYWRALCYKATHKRVSTANSLPHTKLCYFLFRRNHQSHVLLLSLAFFCSALTPALSMHTIRV